MLYTSSEDPDYFYKSYIEDIVYGLKNIGAKLIPPYKYLRTNNNKVLMEILRDQFKIPELNTQKSRYFGTAAILFSKECFIQKDPKWIAKKTNRILKKCMLKVL